MSPGRCCSAGHVLYQVRFTPPLPTPHLFNEKIHRSSYGGNACFLSREKAEQTVWNRLQQLTALKKKRTKSGGTPIKIGILGELFKMKSPFPGCSIVKTLLSVCLSFSLHLPLFLFLHTRKCDECKVCVLSVWVCFIYFHYFEGWSGDRTIGHDACCR